MDNRAAARIVAGSPALVTRLRQGLITRLSEEVPWLPEAEIELARVR